MKRIILIMALAASSAFAEHVYPQNPDPEHMAFFGQLGRDNIVVTNAPPSMSTNDVKGIVRSETDGKFLKLESSGEALRMSDGSATFDGTDARFLGGAQVAVSGGAEVLVSGSASGLRVFSGSTLSVQMGGFFDIDTNSYIHISGDRDFDDFGLYKKAAEFAKKTGDTFTGVMTFNKQINTTRGIYDTGGLNEYGYSYFASDSETEFDGGSVQFRDGTDVLFYNSPLELSGNSSYLRIKKPQNIWLAYEDGEGWDPGFGAYETLDERIVRLAPSPDFSTNNTELVSTATAIVREHSGDYWDEELQVWWTGRMSGGKLTYMATTNVNLNAEH